MAYTSNQLITGAYYAAGVVSREFQTISGTELADGLGWLNDILTEKRIDDSMIPYESTYTFASQIGVEKYWIPGLIEIDTLVFYLQSVRYAIKYTKRNQYFGTARVESITSLPIMWFFERQTNGGNLYIYFEPNQDYPMEVHGSFGLSTVTASQNLLNTVTTADLGPYTFYFDINESATLEAGNFVVNGFDLMGTYDNIGSLINYINSGVIPGVSASIVVNDFVLSSNTEPPIPIYVQTAGYPPNGTKFVSIAAAAQFGPLNSFVYNNGVNGIGATLTNTTHSVFFPDSYLAQLNDLILVIDQTNPSQNGLYVVTVVGGLGSYTVLTRAPSYNQPVQINQGNLFNILHGTIYGGTTLVQTADVSDIGISPIEFSGFSALTFTNFSTIGLPAYEVFNPIGFDQFYITYLRYALASRICAEYNYTVPDGVAQQLSKYEAWIRNKSRALDLEITKASTLGKRDRGLTWAAVNLARGWFPS